MFAKQSKGYKESLELFKKLQLGFKDIRMEVIIDFDKEMTLNARNVPNHHLDKEEMFLITIHNIYDNQGKVVANRLWNQETFESEGTKKIMDLSGPLFDTLLKGKILVVDELDAKLHPLITMQIINLFNNPENNPNNAQLLFATHDTNLLSTEIFRRDQVWFTEKDDVEQTDLYSLDDFVFADGSKVRKDANLEKNYIAGRYGAIPYITNL